MKILHMADGQLGKPMASIAEADTRALVQQARLEALEHVVRVAAEEAVGAVLVAGDLFDSPRVTRQVVSAACAAFGKMPCPVYVIPGNHDHGGPGSIWEQPFFRKEREELAPNLHVCLEAEPVRGDGLVLFPCPLLRRADAADTTGWLRDPEVLEVAGTLPRVVLAHGSAVDFSGEGRDSGDDAGASNHLDLDRLPWEAIDYVALGDWHGTREIRPKAWYSGTHEPDRFPKGDDYRAGQVLLVEIERGRSPEVRPCPVGVLSWRREVLTVHSAGDLEAWEEGLREMGQRDVLHLEVEGTLGFAGLTRLDSLLESLRARVRHLRLENYVRLAPDEDEILALTRDSANPVLAAVATRLLDQTAGDAATAAAARLALQYLHAGRNRSE